MSERVAFLGLGSMGLPMAQNLAAAGFSLRTWNRTASKAALVQGAVACSSPREAAQGAGVALTMLADDAALEAVVFGEQGLIEGLAPGAVHAGLSTCSVAMARRLQREHAARGQRYVSAPVFGRPDAARARLLWIVPGGEPEALQRCAPLFAALGQGTLPMASAEQASLAKLIGNFLIASTMEALAEALALGEKAGLDAGRLIAFLGDALFAGSRVVKGYGERIAATQFEPAGFALPLGLKDVKLALAAGEELRVPLPIASLLRDHIVAALARGRERMDWAALATVVREEAGLPAIKG
jgi:3-hydroxyisobutyrate dehydrogenase-like beta-hydroxyacid dehydrogenase